MSLHKIQIQYLSEITWDDGDTCDFDVKEQVDVWRINISSNLPLLDNFLAILQPDEIARANRYYQTKDKDR